MPAHSAVGREAELAELPRRLLSGQSTALVSRGTSAALRAWIKASNPDCVEDDPPS